MKLKQIITLLLFLACLGVGVFLAVRQSDQQTQDKLQVSTSFYPLYDFAQEIGGDKIQIQNVTPAGAEPHDFEPSAQQLVAAKKAGVFIYNGSNFEPWAEKFTSDYQGISIKANTGLALHEADTADHDSESHAHQADPHFWLDPVLAQQIVGTIRDGLSQAQPADKAYFSNRADAYIQKLQKLDAAYKTGLQNCSQQTVVASHAALGYVAERYGFTATSIAGVSPEAEPSAAQLAKIADLVRQNNIKYILFETLVSPRLADTIAQETGAQTAVFNPLEGLTNDDQKQGKNYISVQYDNLAALRTALACQ